MSPAATALMTAEEFYDLPDPIDGAKQELVRGEVVTMPSPGFEHGEVQTRIASAVYVFLKTNPIGRVATESGAVTERGPDTVRGPDVSYYSAARMPLGQRVKKYPAEAPALCVEVVSPSNSTRKLRDKAKEYLFAGVRMVWIVDPDDRTVTVITEPLESRVLEVGATLDGGDVLPGYRRQVEEFFA